LDFTDREPFVGMVVRSDGPLVTVRDGAQGEWRCVLRGRLRRMMSTATNPVAVGDRVEVRPVGAAEGVVEKVLPRRSQLARRAVRQDTGPRGEHVLAANLDLAVVVVAAPPRPTVIDRYLAVTRAGGCASLVCVNKIDLVDRSATEAKLTSYAAADVPLLLTSALQGDGIADLRRAIEGRLVAFIGPSGAGKSSLLNALEPALGLRVGALSATGKGAHTTTWAATYSVAGGLVVDTPGLREIGFLENEGADAADDLFPEITALARGCRFRDCTHTHEPRCAVKVELEACRLDAEMYRRYARLVRSGRV
jgi:ribosome biogenesis GTPase